MTSSFTADDAADHAAGDLVLAIDVGGSTIKGELVSPSGDVLASERLPTPMGAAARDAIAGLGQRLLDPHAGRRVVGAGVVVPGIVDAVSGTAVYSANVGWRDLDLVKFLGATWELPVRIGNDVASAGVAEWRAGAGAGEDDIAFVVVGTGIAAAVVSGGHLVSGHRGETSELGHVVVRPGTVCQCGGDGCLEAVASATAIGRRYTELSGTAVNGSADVVARLGHDEVARAVWQEAVEALADGLTIVSLLVSPAVTVIGGGLGKAGDALLDPLRVALAERARVIEPPQLAVAAFGERGGVVGAAMLAREGWPS